MPSLAQSTPQAAAIRKSVFATRRQWMTRLKSNEQEMLGIFKRSESRVSAEIQRLADKNGLPPSRLIRLRERLRAQGKELRDEIARGVGKSVKDSAAFGIEAQAGAVEPFLPGNLKGALSPATFADVNRSAVSAIVNRKIDGLALSDRIWRLSTQLETDVMRVIASGVAQGRDPVKIAADLRRGLGLKLKPGALPGKYKSAFDNYLRISRTESSRGYNEGSLRYNKKRKWANFVEHQLSAGHPKLDPCDLYSSQDLYGVGPGVYPSSAAPMLPIHPHCMCSWLPYVDWEQIFTGTEGLVPTRNKGRLNQPTWAIRRAEAKWNSLLMQAKKTGQPLSSLLPRLAGRKLTGGKSAVSVPRLKKRLTTEMLLEREELAIRTNSFETAIIIDPDANKVVFRKKGGKSNVQFEPGELTGTRGKVFTHNHPSSRSLSDDDIRLASYYEMSEMRATANAIMKENGSTAPGFYSMKPPDSGWSGQTWSQKIEPAYLKYDAEVKAEFWPRILSGDLPVEKANALHGHEVWTRVAKETGLKYERVFRK